MHIERLQLVNFKSYEQQFFEFHPKLNALVGNNGVGKTNVLDAIHYLCVGKSYFYHQDKAHVRHGEDFFRLESYFKKSDISDKIVCKFSQRSKKQLELNDISYQKFSDHIGKFPLVLICPDDVKLINEGSEERRKLVDFTLSQLYPAYLSALIEYNRILLQRNSLLKTNPQDTGLLSVYDEQLAPLGGLIYAHRRDFFGEFQPIFADYYQKIAQNEELVGLEYHSDLQQGDFLSLLRQAYQQDMYLQRSSRGPHRDDFSCLLYGQTAKNIASQGQKKSFLLALKLSQYHILAQKSQLAPILLLDDLFDKLDMGRVSHLLSILLQAPFGQIFISDTDPNRVQKLLQGHSYTLFDVNDIVNGKKL